MLSNRLAFGALSVACLAAAAGGGYLATRQNAASVVSADAVAEPAVPLTAPAPAPETVASTPAIVPAPAGQAIAGEPPVVRSESRDADREAARRPAATARSQPVSTRPAEPAGSAAEPAEVARPAAAATPLEARVIETRDLAVTPAVPDAAFEELVVPADSVIGLHLDTTVTSERARVEDRVEARVVRDVRADGRVAVPAGTRAIGSVMLVERGGRFKERARLGIRFHTLVLADNTELPLSTETIYRYGEAPGGESAKKIGGGAVAGAILGAILGGSKGAAIGATAGAGGGTAAVLADDVNAATFPAGTELTARILSPVTLTIER